MRVCDICVRIRYTGLFIFMHRYHNIIMRAYFTYLLNYSFLYIVSLQVPMCAYLASSSSPALVYPSNCSSSTRKAKNDPTLLQVRVSLVTATWEGEHGCGKVCVCAHIHRACRVPLGRDKDSLLICLQCWIPLFIFHS